MRMEPIVIGMLACSLATSAVAETAKQSEVAKVVRTAFDAMNRNDLAALRAFYDSNATLIDDMAPYAWGPPGAFGAWVEAEGAWMSRNRVTDVQCRVDHVERNEVSGDTAYFVGRGGCEVTMNKATSAQSGVWTIVLRHGPQGWRATFMAFGGEALHPR